MVDCSPVSPGRRERQGGPGGPWSHVTHGSCSRVEPSRLLPVTGRGKGAENRVWREGDEEARPSSGQRQIKVTCMVGHWPAGDQPGIRLGVWDSLLRAHSRLTSGPHLSFRLP